MTISIFLNKKVFIISFIRLLSALPFAVFYSSLELYLINIHFPNNTAMVGSVLALSFGLSLLGGYLGGRLLSYKQLFLLSILFQTIGCFVFYTHNDQIVLWLSSIFLLGSIGNTISLNMMLTQLFVADDHRREKSFFILYMYLNLGYLAGYSVAGYYANQDQYNILPFIITFTSILALSIILVNWKNLDAKILPKKKHGFIKLIGIFSVSFILLRLLLEHPLVTNSMLIVFWLLLAITMYFKIVSSEATKKSSTAIFYVLLFAALVFWSVYLLAPMALIVFIKYYVNLRIGSVLIAPQWIQNINTIIIIVGSVLFSLSISNNSVEYLKKQFAKGLLLIGLGFLVLTLGIFFAQNKTSINIIWIIASYILQSWGELFIGPIGYSLVGKLIPEAYQSIMTGIWATVLGVASAIASFLSSSVLPSGHENLVKMSPDKFNYLFITMTTITILVALSLVFKKVGRYKKPTFF